MGYPTVDYPHIIFPSILTLITCQSFTKKNIEHYNTQWLIYIYTGGHTTILYVIFFLFSAPMVDLSLFFICYLFFLCFVGILVFKISNLSILSYPFFIARNEHYLNTLKQRISNHSNT